MTARDTEVLGNQAGILMISQFSEMTRQSLSWMLSIPSRTLLPLCHNFTTGLRETQTLVPSLIPPSWRTSSLKTKDSQLPLDFLSISKVTYINHSISEIYTPKSTPLVTEVVMTSLPSLIIKLRSSMPSGTLSSSRTMSTQRDHSPVYPWKPSKTRPTPSSVESLLMLRITNQLTSPSSEMSLPLLLNTSMKVSLRVRTKLSPKTTLTSITPLPFRELPWPPLELLTWLSKSTVHPKHQYGPRKTSHHLALHHSSNEQAEIC